MMFVILFLYLCFLGSSQFYGTDFSYRFGAGNASSFMASGEAFLFDTSPANLSSLTGITLGGFYSDFSYKEEDINNFGFFIGVPWNRLGFSAFASGPNIKFLNKIGAAFSFPLYDHLHSGLYISLKKTETQYIIQANSGILHKFPVKKIFGFGFGIHQLNIAFALEMNIPSAQPRETKERLLGGLYSIFFRYKFVELDYSQQLISRNGFSYFTYAHGLRMSVFRIFFLEGGIRFDEEFKVNTGFIGSSLNIPFETSMKWLININYSFPVFESRIIQNLSFASSIGYQFYGSSRLNEKPTRQRTLLKYIIEPSEKFTPNADGKNDILKIYLYHPNYTKLRNWNLIIKNADDKTVSVIQPNILDSDSENLFDFPKLIRWYGKDHKGRKMPDGNYHLYFVALLPEIKQKKWDMGAISLDSIIPQFKIDLPKNDYLIGQQKEFKIHLKDILGDIQQYNIQIQDTHENIIFHKKIEKANVFSWNGSFVPGFIPYTGNFLLKIFAVDNAGNRSRNIYHNIHIFDQQEKIALRFSDTIFTNRSDRIYIYPIHQFKSQIQNWNVYIRSTQSKKIVRSYKGKNYLPIKLTWDGTDQGKQRISSGRYNVLFRSELKNGSRLNSVYYTLRIDTYPPQLTLEVDHPMFTPDTDGIDDLLKVSINSHDDSSIQKYLILIKDQYKNIIKREENKGNPPSFFFWDGIKDSGFSVDSYQNYFISMVAMDSAGNFARSNELKIKTGLLQNNFSSDPEIEKPKTILSFPNIIFPFAKSIPTYLGKGVLKKIARFLLIQKKMHIIITGHADSRGSFLFNQVLSYERALYVKNYLKNFGLNDFLIKAFGAGSTDPLFKEDSEEARSKNRRVEITLKNI